MSMPNPGFGNQFPAKAPTTKITDIAPGSTIEVRDTKQQVPPFSGTVLEVKREYGVTSIPALIVKVDGAAEPVVVTDSGRWHVTVSFDSRLMAAEADPASVVVARRKPETVRCIQFKGGVDSATEIIRWAGGRAHLTWERGGMGTDEHLALSSMRGSLPIAVGDWLLENADGTFYQCTPSAFTVGYDIVSATEFAPVAPPRYLDPEPTVPTPDNEIPWGQFQPSPTPEAWNLNPAQYAGAGVPPQPRAGFIPPVQ